MKRSFLNRALVAILAGATWICPTLSQLHAAPPPARTLPPASVQDATPIRDVELGAGGSLQGQVMNAQGAPAAGELVMIEQRGVEIRRVSCDEQGQFVASGLRGGVYEVKTRNSMNVFRCWANRTAPPAARDQVLLVSDATAVNGQRPIADLLFNPVTVILGVAAAIVIPLALTNNDDDTVIVTPPASP